jgi:hypothetical protein
MAALLLAAALAACTQHVPYRAELTACDNSQDPRACAAHFIESHPEYLLGFVEFDDQGWFWDRRQMWKLLDVLSAEVHRQDLLIVVFAHGWKHNANVCDGNVCCFRETLKQISRLERSASGAAKREPRKVVGIYLGWRGLSLEGEWLANLSFWERKNTAAEVGHGAVTELLARLNSLRYIHRHVTGEPTPTGTQLVIVGHSFGGAVVYSAVSQLLVDRFIDYRGEGKPPEAFGDLVVLVNPAFEATRYETLHAMALERSYLPGQLPILAVMTSYDDQATRKAFPLGRWFSTWFEQYRSKDQDLADHRTVGHFPRHRTHTLTATAPPARPPRPAPDAAERCACPYFNADALRDKADTDLRQLIDYRSAWRDGRLAPGWQQEFPGTLLTHRPSAPGSHPLNPFLVIGVDDQVIHGHNDIYRPAFIDFLRQMILLSAPGK